jgi:hypothetical protein
MLARAAVVALCLMPGLAAGATYHYSIRSGAIPCTLAPEPVPGYEHQYRDCSQIAPLEPLEITFSIREALLPGGSLANAELEWAPERLSDEPLPAWLDSPDLTDEYDTTPWHARFYLRTGPNREVLALSMAYVYIGELGWYLSYHDGVIWARWDDGCERQFECLRYEGESNGEPTLVSTPVPLPAAVLPFLAGLLALSGLSALRRR